MDMRTSEQAKKDNEELLKMCCCCKYLCKDYRCKFKNEFVNPKKDKCRYYKL